MTALRREAFRLLRQHRRQVVDQIGGYPAPIPACDAQFNHLMEQRRLLTRERARLLAVRGNGQVSVEEFLRRSPLTHDGVTAGR